MSDVVKQWYKLDNAATIYPYSSNKKWICGYRIGFVMKEDVDPDALKQAVRDIMPRFPSYFVQLRFGYFWPYLERAQFEPIVEQEHNYPIMPVPRWYTDVPAMRFIYYKRRLCIEAFHGIADGGATIEVLKALTAKYLEIKGIDIPKSEYIMDIEEQPKISEVCDSFKANYSKEKGFSRKESVSYQHKIKPIENYNRLFHGIVPVSDIKEPCKSHDITITEFLAAVFIYSLYMNAPESNKKAVKVSIPVSLRPYFNSDSMRNFSLFTNIGLTPKPNKETTLEEIIAAIKGKLRQGTQKEILQGNLNLNVSTATNPIVRVLPNGIKKSVLKIGYKNGQQKYACSISNLGICKMPPEMKAHIDRMEVMLGGPRNMIGCAINSIDSNLVISFNVASKQTDVIKTFFTTLSSMGIRVRVESSDKEASL